MDLENEEFVLPTSLIEHVTPTSDIVSLSKACLAGFVPPYVEIYRDKIQSILRMMSSETTTPIKRVIL